MEGTDSAGTETDCFTQKERHRPTRQPSRLVAAGTQFELPRPSPAFRHTTSSCLFLCFHYRKLFFYCHAFREYSPPELTFVRCTGDSHGNPDSKLMSCRFLLMLCSMLMSSSLRDGQTHPFFQYTHKLARITVQASDNPMAGYDSPPPPYGGPSSSFSSSFPSSSSPVGYGGAPPAVQMFDATALRKRTSGGWDSCVCCYCCCCCCCVRACISVSVTLSVFVPISFFFELLYASLVYACA